MSIRMKRAIDCLFSLSIGQEIILMEWNIYMVQKLIFQGFVMWLLILHIYVVKQPFTEFHLLLRKYIPALKPSTSFSGIRSHILGVIRSINHFQWHQVLKPGFMHSRLQPQITPFTSNTNNLVSNLSCYHGINNYKWVLRSLG